MSDTVPPGEPPTATGRSAAIVAIVAQLTFLAALGAAWFLAWNMKDNTLLITLSGAAAANATTVINYYIGSSASSARKTEIIAASPAIPTARSEAIAATADMLRREPVIQSSPSQPPTRPGTIS